MKKIIATFALFSALAYSPVAQAADYIFEKPHTQILFGVEHMGLSISYGRFLDFDGTFSFDDAAVEDSKIDIKIHTDSLEMNHKKWTSHVKNADLLDVEKYPEMHFVSTAIKKTGENTGLVTGDLTMMGVTKPVTLDVTYKGSKVNPYSQNHMVGFTATGNLKRSDFGMTYGIPNVGDDVALTISVEGIRQDKLITNE